MAGDVLKEIKRRDYWFAGYWQRSLLSRLQRQPRIWKWRAELDGPQEPQ